MNGNVVTYSEGPIKRSYRKGLLYSQAAKVSELGMIHNRMKTRS